MKRYTLTNPLDEIRHYRRRLIVLAVLMSLLLLALIGRLFYLQVNQHNYYLTLSQQNLLSVAPIDPSRGLIYDRNGVLLAGNMPVFSLEIVPDKVPSLKETLQALGKIITLTPADLQAFKKQLAQNRRFNPVPLKVKLTDQEIAVFAVNQYRFPGVIIQAHLVRYYPFGPLMEPILGYVGRINVHELKQVDPTNYSASNYIGKTGIEKYDETLLHGTVGVQQQETGAQGQVVRSTENRPATAGANLYLSIDSRLQQIAWQGLQGQPGGAVIAVNPNNGEILALVSKPAFDPNQFVTGISAQAYHALQIDPTRPLFNRALQGEFPSGSTIKPFYALEGLSSGVITPSSSFFCPGYFELPHSTHKYHCWRRTGHGSVDVENAVFQSCDVFFFHLAMKMGITRIDDILHDFGFGQATNIDTDSEQNGLVPSPEWKKRVHHQAWYPGDTVITGIGQGYLLVTPLQLAQAMMRLVEEGKGYQLHLLQRSESPGGNVSVHAPIALQPLVLPKSNWQLVLQAMREVTADRHGTGYQAALGAPYTFAGKSGTAQVFSLKKGQQDKAGLLPEKLRDDSWFEVFAPATHPTVVLIVFIEHGGEGEATMIVRHILDGYFKLYPVNSTMLVEKH